VKVLQVEAPGGPEQLVSRETQRPSAGRGEVLVRTHTVGVNFIETYQRSGIYSMPLPFTPGEEASGIVEAVGEGVDTLNVGDRVTTAEAKATYAEYFVAAAVGVVRVPDHVPLDIAGALPLQGLTAHYLGTSSANPQPGETVIVHAGAGGVGLLLTQLLAARGVRVFTTVSTEAKAELSRNAGAAEVLAYDDFRGRSRELTGGEGVSVVYDGVGKTTFDDSLASLRIRGTMVLFGGASGQVPPFDLQRLNTSGSLSITRPTIMNFLRTPQERAWRYGDIFAALEDGTLDVRIGARFPLADAAKAHAALESRGTTGKVILEA
jgi:NADPH2:quinone reductase